MKSLKYVLPGLIFAALLVAFYQGLFLNPREVPSPLIGKPAPAFELEELSRPEERFATSDMFGRPRRAEFMQRMRG